MPLLAELLALIAPPGCLACRARCRGPGTACAWTARARCRGCARGVGAAAYPPTAGKRCPAARASFPRAWAPLAYQGVARMLVAALKFRGALAVADLMAAQMVANLPADLRDSAGVLVPVPPVGRRRRRRGFDQARVLSVALARRTDRPLVECLVRAGRGARQVGASRRERRAPGRLEIQVRGSSPPLAILVDDVHTTGATLEACARALAAEGTTVVAAISYARTL